MFMDELDSLENSYSLRRGRQREGAALTRGLRDMNLEGMHPATANRVEAAPDRYSGEKTAHPGRKRKEAEE